jgi:DNA-binding transcriptional MerR regulator
MAASELMRIGQLSERTGKTARALRLYEELGILVPAERTASGYRLYDESAVLRIEWIDRLSECGFSLNETQQFLKDLHGHVHGPAQMMHLRRFYEIRQRETKAQIERLQRLSHELEASLEYLSTCQNCAPSTHKSQCISCSEHEDLHAPKLVAAIHAGQN